MKVCLVAPTCRDSDLPFGGGERYVEELARALATFCTTRLVSFGRHAVRENAGRLERVVLRSWTSDPLTPFSPRLRGAIRGFDIVHTFQYFTLPTFLALRWAKRGGSRTFVTDLGGGGWTPGYQIDQSRWLDAHLPLSAYAARSLPGRNRHHKVIYGGVDLGKFRMRERGVHDGSVVSLGRLLPHKGVHHLIDAMPPDVPLHVIGPVADREYVAGLRNRAAGKRVAFHHDLSDDAVVRYLQAAMALVHPTPVDESGSAQANELLGLAVLEAMACGCPVIASRAASLPELVRDHHTGFLVEPNDPDAIRAAIAGLRGMGDEWQSLSVASRLRVDSDFRWSSVVERCLETYVPSELTAHESGATSRTLDPEGSPVSRWSR